MDKELENQKQIKSWDNSMPQTNKYMDTMDVVRQGNMANLTCIIEWIRKYIKEKETTVEELQEIKKMLLKIKVATEEDEIYPYEIPIMIAYKAMINELDKEINKTEEAHLNE